MWFVIVNLLQFVLQAVAMRNVMTIIDQQYVDHNKLPKTQLYAALFERVLLRRYGMFMYVFWTAVTVGNLCTFLTIVRWRGSSDIFSVMNRYLFGSAKFKFSQFKLCSKSNELSNSTALMVENL